MDRKDTMGSGDREREEIVWRVTAQYVEEMEAGHQPDSSEYIARYPQYADAIASFIAYYRSVEEPVLQMMDSQNAAKNVEDREDADEFAENFHIAEQMVWKRVIEGVEMLEGVREGLYRHAGRMRKHQLENEQLSSGVERLQRVAEQSQGYRIEGPEGALDTSFSDLKANLHAAVEDSEDTTLE